MFKKYKLKRKEELLRKIRIKNMPTSIRGEEALQRNFEELNDEIANFYLILSENLPFAVPNFLDRLSSLDIIITRSSYKEHTGKYDNDSNNLVVYLPISGEYEISPDFRETLYHELLHMASSYNHKEKDVSGFLNEIKTTFSTIKIGSILNEGYTELLTKRYFKCTDNEYYKKEVILASRIEEFIGREEMEKAYFEGNLDYIIERFNDAGIDGLSFIQEINYVRLLLDDKYFNEVLNKIPKSKKDSVKKKQLNK